MLRSLFFVLYGVLWALAKPLLKKHKRLREGYGERTVREGWQELKGKKPADLWIQAASGGEAYLCLEMLKCLPQTENPLHILCTSMTKQGIEVLLKGRDVLREKGGSVPEISVLYFPFDDKKSMAAAFGLARPKCCVLLETELWPCFMRTAKKCGVPLYIVNARMTEKTFAAYKKIKSVFSECQPDGIFATREKDRDFYKEIFPNSSCGFMHNIKFDMVYNELCEVLAGRKKNPLAETVSAQACVYLFASVREEEEKLLLPLAEKLHRDKTKSTVIIAPRHTARFGEWKKALSAKGAGVRLLTEILESGQKVQAGDIVVWDRFGDLKNLYALADYAFVGGSLVPLGGQNFMEPLVYGVIPHTGVYLDNFLWAFEMQGKGKNLAEENLLCLYKDIEGLTEVFLALPEKKFSQHAEIQQRFKTWLKPLIGDTKKTVESIFHDMKK